MRLPLFENKSRRTAPLFSPFVMGLIRPMNVSCVYSVCAVSASPPQKRTVRAALRPPQHCPKRPLKETHTGFPESVRKGPRPPTTQQRCFFRFRTLPLKPRGTLFPPRSFQIPSLPYPFLLKAFFLCFKDKNGSRYHPETVSIFSRFSPNSVEEPHIQCYNRVIHKKEETRWTSFIKFKTSRITPRAVL